MATSGSVSIQVTDWDSLVFEWTRESVSIDNNTSTITWAMKLVATAYGRISASSQSPWSITVNGTQYTGKANLAISNNSTKTLASGTQVIPHNEDGTKSFSFSFSQTFNITFSSEYIGTISGSGTGTLDTIARASQPSCITYPENTQNVGEFGDTISIHMNRKSSAFTHKVRYQFGSMSGTCIDAETGKEATAVGTGFRWKIPEKFMILIPSATAGSGTIFVDTYNGSTLIGTKYTGFTATVPASVKPTCSFTLEDITGVDDIYGSPVQGLSQIKIRVAAQGAYGSNVVSCQITADGVKYNKSVATTDYLRNAGTSTVSAIVTDQRGRTGSISYDMNVQAYTAPAITALSVRRCDSDGTTNDQGAYVKASFAAAVSAMSNKNTAAYTLNYKKSTASSWTSIYLSSLDDVYSVSDSYVFAADGSSSYDVELIVADRHDTASKSTSASTAFTLMNFNASGTGIAFGKVSEIANAFECALDMFDKWGTAIGNGKAAYGGTSNPLDADTCLDHIFLTTVNVPDSRFWYVIQVFYSTKSETGNRAQIAIPYSFSAPIHFRYKYGGSDWHSWKTDLDADDTGWVNATSLLKSAFAPYTDNDYPCYRRVGKTVSLNGTVKPTSEIDSSSGEVTIYTLPADCRPTVAVFQLCQGSGNAMWLCGVHTNGNVTISRYRDFSCTTKYDYSAVPTSEWLKFHVVFLTA